MNSNKKLLIGFGIILVILIIFLLNGRSPGQPGTEYELDGVNIEIVQTNEEPEGLHPVVEDAQERLIEQAEEIEIEVGVTEGYRSIEEQDALYEQGRTTEGSIVTNAEGGHSYHNFGLAIDFALINEDGEAIWDMEYDGNENGTSDWLEVVAIAKELGFEWGGDWRNFPDYPHLQMTFGLRISELQDGYRPVVVDDEE